MAQAAETQVRAQREQLGDTIDQAFHNQMRKVAERKLVVKDEGHRIGAEKSMRLAAHRGGLQSCLKVSFEPPNAAYYFPGCV